MKTTTSLMRATFVMMLLCMLSSVKSFGQQLPVMPPEKIAAVNTESELQELYKKDLLYLQSIITNPAITASWTQEQMDRALYQEWELKIVTGESNTDGTPIDAPDGLSPNASLATANDVVISPPSPK